MSDTRITDAQLAGILDIADDAIISIDQSQRIILFNKGAERMFGYAAEEAVGQPLALLLPLATQARHERHVAGFGESPTSSRRMGERRSIAGRRRDGTEFPAEASISSLTVGERRIYTAIVRDVTEQRRQAELLRSAKRAAEVAVQAKSMFLANMSHEIRTPLNAIIGMSSLMLESDLGEEQRDFAETIRSSSDALLTVINEILDFTKIELGSLEIDPHPFDVRRAIESSLDVVAGTAAEKNLNLAYWVDDTVPPIVVSDGSRLRQILLNILSNAVKFTRSGEVVVNVEAQRGSGDEYELHFSVTDTGIGIAPEEQDKLFKPFSQVDASTTREFGGTGLGLAISHRLCEMLGGRIWVESAAGQGSTFHFTVIVTKGEAQLAPYLQGDQPLLAGKRLLVVDDNTTNRRLVVKHALKWGMLPQAVASPQEALDFIRHGHALDFAVLDMSMPHMDGLKLAKAIRQTRDAKSLPLVMLSSMGQRAKSAEAEGVDFAAHLLKPIKPGQLFEVLLGLAGRSDAPAETARPAGAASTRLAETLPLQILVAEDNLVNQKVVVRILSHLGYRADVAATGREVLDALERRGYDVILMDVQMPDMDGIAATRRIHERFAGKRRPGIIAMTANALRGDRERCLSAGMDDYLCKPIELNDLAGALARSRAPRSDPVVKVRNLRAGRSAIDTGQMHNLLQIEASGSTGLLDELCGHFFAEVPAAIAEMSESAADGDALAVGRIAHRLSSTALACGAMRVAEACGQLEQCAANGTLWLFDSLVDRLRLEFDAAREALEEIRREPVAHPATAR